jgi:cytochrome c-type biogenesis protein CcmE
MSPSQRNRLITISTMLFGVSIAAGLVLYALSQNINLFYMPEDVQSSKAKIGETIRMGGMVQHGSFKRDEGLNVSFLISDYKYSVKVNYTGMLPDLFREGQGVVVQGKLTSQNNFVAKEVLAKHDEKYMPPQVAKKMSKQELQSSLVQS